jgi:hypothetical protein
MAFENTQMQSEISRSYNSFSGSDIRAMIGPYQFAEIQALSYSITREKAPIYTMGCPDPRSFSRNKRGIAGSLVWINFDRHALLDVFRNAQGQFIANKDDIRPAWRTSNDAVNPDTAIFNAAAQRSSQSSLAVGATIDAFRTQPLQKVTGFKEKAYAWTSDQCVPFDVTLVGVNELGAAAAMKVLGVEILNEGGGVSIDDAVTEMQATFVARLIEPWQTVQSEFSNQNLYSA